MEEAGQGCAEEKPDHVDGDDHACQQRDLDSSVEQPLILKQADAGKDGCDRQIGLGIGDGEQEAAGKGRGRDPIVAARQRRCGGDLESQIEDIDGGNDRQHQCTVRHGQQDRDDPGRNGQQHRHRAGDKTGHIAKRSPETIGRAHDRRADRGGAGASHDDQRGQKQCHNGIVEAIFFNHRYAPPDISRSKLSTTKAGRLERLCRYGGGRHGCDALARHKILFF